jgi:hypothetical protein
MTATPEKPTPKRPYSMPTLSKYGDLTQLTESVSKKATMMDGGNNAVKSG